MWRKAMNKAKDVYVITSVKPIDVTIMEDGNLSFGFEVK